MLQIHLVFELHIVQFSLSRHRIQAPAINGSRQDERAGKGLQADCFLLRFVN